MGSPSLKLNDIDLYQEFWEVESRKNFYVYRQYIGSKDFKKGWFHRELSKALQQFYFDFVNNERPILIIEAPPQHGKSRTIAEFISWFLGKLPDTKTIYSSYSDSLGIRTNRFLQRTIDTEKYQRIFEGKVKLGSKKIDRLGKRYVKNSDFFEIVNHDGSFRNTTVNGGVTGESLDLGVIDDPVKGRAESNSKTIQEKTFDWFSDDFYTRFSEYAGLLIVLTRWSKIDLAERLKKTEPNVKTVTFKAIAETDEEFRKEGEALFPEHKSKEFLLKRKAMYKKKGAMYSWHSLYQQSPTVRGGNIFKDKWWKWWKHLPIIKYKFITADTAQKLKTQNDWTVFQCWGYGVDNNIYLLDKKRARFEAPELRKEAWLFYKKHNLPRINITDPLLRGMYIEDKSSGTGLIQELRRKKAKVYEIPRNTDKYTRGEDASPEVKAGRVFLNEDIPGIDNLTEEGREFPNGAFDDDIDTAITAIEVAFLNEDKHNSLRAAMEAD